MIRWILNYFALIVICPILIFWLKGRFFKWLRDDKNRIDRERKEWDVRENSHMDKALSKVYMGERHEWYLECKGLFNGLMKEGQLSRKELLYLKGLIGRLIGGYIEDYKKFKYESDVHEIYIKLKCQHLDRSDFEEIGDYLRECGKIVKVKVVKENTKEKEGKVV